MLPMAARRRCIGAPCSAWSGLCMLDDASTRTECTLARSPKAKACRSQNSGWTGLGLHSSCTPFRSSSNRHTFHNACGPGLATKWKMASEIMNHHWSHDLAAENVGTSLHKKICRWRLGIGLLCMLATSRFHIGNTELRPLMLGIGIHFHLKQPCQAVIFHFATAKIGHDVHQTIAINTEEKG